MAFVTPLFFWGALAAAVPVLLHLIRRESGKKFEFPTLMFLRRVDKKTIRYQKLRHLLLLLLRMLVLLFLALAFTRPFREMPQAAAMPGRTAATHVILLDNSLSMGYRDRWERGRAAASDIARGIEPGDKVALLEFSDQTHILAGPVTGPDAVLAELRRTTEPEDRPTRYGQALKVAEQVALGAGGRRIIHLISDFQKSGWAAEERDFRLGSGIELVGVDVGSDEFSNLTLGDVRMFEGDDEGGEVRVRFSVVNFGSEDRPATSVRLLLDERDLEQKSLDIGKGGVEGSEFRLQSLDPGIHSLVLRVEDPRLERDNRFAMTIETRGKTPALMVENPSSGRQGRPPSFFLSRAMNISDLSPYRLSTISPQNFASSGAVAGSLVVWNNIAGGGTAVQQKLRNFVEAGGGLAVVLSDPSLAGDFNRSFGSWIPVKAGSSARPGGSRPLEDYLLLTDISMEHPIFLPFREPHSGSFSTAKFFVHVPLTAGEGARVLARFDNGDPALISAETGKGRVLVWASSVDDTANDLPVKAVFAPFWHQVFRYLENFRQRRGWLMIGDSFAPGELIGEAALKQGKADPERVRSVVVLNPAGGRVPVTNDADAVSADMTGFYEVRAADIRTSVAVNPDPSESDLTHGDMEEMIAGWISREAQAPPVASPDERLSDEDQDKRQRLWRYLLLAVLVFFMAEGVLANQSVLKSD